MEDDVQPAIQAFIQSGSKKTGEKPPFILFEIGTKKVEGKKAKEIIRILKKGECHQTYDDLVEILLATKAAYALCDYRLNEDEKKQCTLKADTFPIFINWTSESASMKDKMIASSSVAVIRRFTSTACKVSLECHDSDDICCEAIFKHIKKNYNL